VSDVEFLRDKKRMKDIQSLLTKKGIVSTMNKDEEHGLFELSIDFQINGMKVSCKVNIDLVRSVEYRNLYKIHEELKGLDPPYTVLSNGDAVKIDNEAKLLDYLFQKGKKGISIQRYKGLGEMAPKQLWETTMDPEERYLLQVSIQDVVEADKIFTILMGDEVEPRRKFIEENALAAQNLDV